MKKGHQKGCSDAPGNVLKAAGHAPLTKAPASVQGAADQLHQALTWELNRHTQSMAELCFASPARIHTHTHTHGKVADGVLSVWLRPAL